MKRVQLPAFSASTMHVPGIQMRYSEVDVLAVSIGYSSPIYSSSQSPFLMVTFGLV